MPFLRMDRWIVLTALHAYTLKTINPEKYIYILVINRSLCMSVSVNIFYTLSHKNS